MKLKIAITLCIALAGCAESESNESNLASADSGSKTVLGTTSVLNDEDITRVCRGGISFRNGTTNSDMKVGNVAAGVVRLSYTRDDGKFFAYDCKIEGSKVRFRMIDEGGPGTGPGTWSGKGSTTTFEVFPGAIEFKDVYMDGSSTTERIVI